MKKVETSVKIAGMVVVGLIVVTLIIISAVMRILPTESVSADGVAEIDVMPDLVSVYFNVEAKGDSAAEAKDVNTVIVDAVVAALVAEGFAREEIVTENFNVYEDFEWDDGSRIPIGFKASHGIKVEFSANETDRIGGTVDAGVDNGAMLRYINFELSQELQNKYKAEALKLAAEDAQIKAEAIATGLGVKVGRVISTSSSNFGYYPRVAYAMEGSEVAVSGARLQTEIQPGKQEVNAQISVTYKLK